MLCSGCATESPQWGVGIGAKNKETAFSWTDRIHLPLHALPLHAQGRWEEQGGKPFCSDRDGTVDRTNCFGPLPQVAEKVLHPLLAEPLLPIPWPLTVTPQGLAAQPCIPELLPLATVTPLQSVNLTLLPTSYSLSFSAHVGCAQSGQPNGLLPWKTLSHLLPHQQTPWFFVGRGSSRAAEVFVSPRQGLQR